MNYNIIIIILLYINIIYYIIILLYIIIIYYILYIIKINTKELNKIYYLVKLFSLFDKITKKQNKTKYII